LIFGMKILIPTFGSPAQIAAIIVTSVFLVIASCGQGLTILLGGIDLSIGVVMGIAGMMIAGLTNGSNDNLLWALPVVIVFCTGIGIINGLGIAFLNIPPLLMTLAMGTTFFGVALGATYGGLQKRVAPALEGLMSGYLLGIPVPVFLLVIFVLLAIIGLNGTGVGRKFYAIGSNLEAGRISGIPISGLTVIAYGLSSFCACLAGLLLAGYSSSATLDMGDPYLLPTIAAVVIAGAKVTGGRGLYFGTFAGAMFLSTLSTILTALSLTQGWKYIIEGGIILAALIVTFFKK
ncbi:MAG: ABC transporter permease, partial [Deltaproteobacteria bacterium]|nr:ABC transporter permease [Deltaproteobacteria bacterium]